MRIQVRRMSPLGFLAFKTSGVLHANFASAVPSTFAASSVLGTCLVPGFSSKALIPLKQKFSAEFVGWALRSAERVQLVVLLILWSVSCQWKMS